MDGFGDYAGWDESSRQLTIFKGPFLVIVSSGGLNVQSQDAMAMSSQAARKVLEKLPQ